MADFIKLKDLVLLKEVKKKMELFYFVNLTSSCSFPPPFKKCFATMICYI